VIQVPGKDLWYVVYHRRPLGETDPNHRVPASTGCISTAREASNPCALPAKASGGSRWRGKGEGSQIKIGLLIRLFFLVIVYEAK
jgi:hypothetical protein